MSCLLALGVGIVIMLALFAIARSKSTSNTDLRARPVAACDFCGETFETRTACRIHLRDEHNAPGDDIDVSALMAKPSELEHERHERN